MHCSTAMIKQLLQLIDQVMHSLISPMFYECYLLPRIFGNFKTVRSWIGGTWIYYWNDITKTDIWESHRGCKSMGEIRTRPGRRGSAYLESYIHRI